MKNDTSKTLKTVRTPQDHRGEKLIFQLKESGNIVVRLMGHALDACGFPTFKTISMEVMEPSNEDFTLTLAVFS